MVWNLRVRREICRELVQRILPNMADAGMQASQLVLGTPITSSRRRPLVGHQANAHAPLSFQSMAEIHVPIASESCTGTALPICRMLSVMD